MTIRERLEQLQIDTEELPTDRIPWTLALEFNAILADAKADYPRDAELEEIEPAQRDGLTDFAMMNVAGMVSATVRIRGALDR